MEIIKSVIFDWGGVLIDDPAPGLMRYCAEALGVTKQEYEGAHRKYADNFDTGRVSEEIFWKEVCAELHVSPPGAESLWGAAFKAVYRPKPDMFALGGELHENGYRTAVLSNTEKPAMEFFYQQGYDMFDAVVFSCAEGTRKPEKQIYELALARLSSDASEAVFIDDRQEYTIGATQAGLNSILFRNTGQVREELARHGVKMEQRKGN